MYHELAIAIGGALGCEQLDVVADVVGTELCQIGRRQVDDVQLHLLDRMKGQRSSALPIKHKSQVGVASSVDGIREEVPGLDIPAFEFNPVYGVDNVHSTLRSKAEYGIS